MLQLALNIGFVGSQTLNCRIFYINYANGCDLSYVNFTNNIFLDHSSCEVNSLKFVTEPIVKHSVQHRSMGSILIIAIIRSHNRPVNR